MGRKDRPRSPAHLNSGDVNVSTEELAIILHGADSVVHQGGRSRLVKLLKGSRDKKILEFGLYADDSYGALSHLALDEIARRVDWVIEEGYLGYYYEWRQPLLMFTDRGWGLERPVAIESLFGQFHRDVDEGELRMAERMADIKNDIQLDVIELIAQRCDERCLRHFEAWSGKATKRIRKRNQLGSEDHSSSQIRWRNRRNVARPRGHAASDARFGSTRWFSAWGPVHQVCA